VLRRESSPYNKLVMLAGVQRQESFEVQVKAPLEKTAVLEFLNSDRHATLCAKCPLPPV
jgi:hypothetical protein